jgi:hypothetical protein
MRSVFFLPFVLLPFISIAQDDKKKDKKINHHAGIQVNQLLRQVVNLNNSAATGNTNPYLLVYSANSKKTGWGFRFGAGYNFVAEGENDGITKRDNNINTLNLRAGLDKAVKFSKKWSAGVGVDAVFNNDNNRTYTEIHAFDTTITETRSLLTSYGGGVAAWLRYYITSRVAIGTEANFYYTFGYQKENVEITTTNSIVPSAPPVTTRSSTSSNVSKAVIGLPTAIYLIVKF